MTEAVDPIASIYRGSPTATLDELLSKIPPPPTLILPGWFTPEQRALVAEWTRDGGWAGVVYSDHVGDRAVVARVPVLPEEIR